VKDSSFTYYLISYVPDFTEVSNPYINTFTILSAVRLAFEFKYIYCTCAVKHTKLKITIQWLSLGEGLGGHVSPLILKTKFGIHPNPMRSR